MTSSHPIADCAAGPRRALVGLVIFLAVIGTGAPADPAEDVRRAFFEPVEVPLVSVDLYVTDADGKPVPGLTVADFEVFEDGQPVAPTHFYAAPAARLPAATTVDSAPPTAPTAAPLADRLLLAVWIDETGLQPRRRRTVLEHLRGFLTEQLPANVEVALVSFDGIPRVRQSFTDDRQQVATTLDLLLAQGASVSRLDEEQILIRRIQSTAGATSVMGSGGLEVQGSDLLGEVQAYAAQAHQRARHSFASLEGFVDTLAAVPGQKIVLLVSDAVHVRPGERVYFQLQQALGMDPGRARAAALSFGRRYDLGRELRELLRRANTNRVSFMTLSAMSERSLGLGSAESRGRSVADMDQIMTEEQTLLTIAGVTGGKVLQSSGRLSQQLEEVATEVASYYSIGYPPPSPADGEYHRLEIRVRREGARIRHREGYVGAEPGDDLVEHTVAAAVLGVTADTIGIAVEPRPAEPREDGSFLVPVLIRVPIGEMVLIPGPVQHEGRLALVLVVRADDGGLSQPERREYPVVIANDDLVRATTSSAGYTLGLVMKAGPHRIAVGVRDELAYTVATAVAELNVGGEE